MFCPFARDELAADQTNEEINSNGEENNLGENERLIKIWILIMYLGIKQRNWDLWMIGEGENI
jgi:hypothetical protein